MVRTSYISRNRFYSEELYKEEDLFVMSELAY